MSLVRSHVNNLNDFIYLSICTWNVYFFKKSFLYAIYMHSYKSDTQKAIKLCHAFYSFCFLWKQTNREASRQQWKCPLFLTNVRLSSSWDASLDHVWCAISLQSVLVSQSTQFWCTVVDNYYFDWKSDIFSKKWRQQQASKELLINHKKVSIKNLF